ncbi:MAG: glycosyl-4,4'-diaponeurosporenoate acyltransferase [bacterium]
MLDGLVRCLVWIALWGLACFPLGRLIRRMSPDWERFPFAEWDWERSGRVYERVGIRLWKDLVPDVSQWFPFIVPKKKVNGRPTAASMRGMLMETCVAELIHDLLCVAGLPLLWLWPGFGGVAVYLVYVILGNIPFILIQRYNRPRYRRLLSAVEARERRLEHAGADTFEQQRRRPQRDGEGAEGAL